MSVQQRDGSVYGCTAAMWQCLWVHSSQVAVSMGAQQPGGSDYGCTAARWLCLWVHSSQVAVSMGVQRPDGCANGCTAPTVQQPYAIGGPQPLTA